MTKQEVIPVTAGAQAHKNIAAALAAAQTQMGKAVKDANNPHFKTKYADLGSVMDACMGALNANGIAVIQPAGEENGNRYVETVFIHESGDKLSCRVPLILGKNDMQGYGSAVTYARRYGLMCMAGIAPEDDDGNAAAAAAPKREERHNPPLRDIETELLEFNAAVDAAVHAMGLQPTPAILTDFWRSLPKGVQSDSRVIEAAKKRKADLTREITADEIPY